MSLQDSEKKHIIEALVSALQDPVNFSLNTRIFLAISLIGKRSDKPMHLFEIP
jgi:hypothetical protein